jgi:hypothetical protein
MRSGFGDVKNVTAGFREVPFAVRCNHTFARNAAFETPAVENRGNPRGGRGVPPGSGVVAQSRIDGIELHAANGYLLKNDERGREPAGETSAGAKRTARSLCLLLG